jgi:hypothetical protein
MSRKPVFRTLSLALLLGAAHPGGAAVTPAGAAKDVVPCPTCSERAPAIAGTKAGKILVGWGGATTLDSRALVARFFISPGQARGNAFAVHAPTEFSTERELAIAGTPLGGFVAAWEAVDPAGDSHIWVRRLDAAGRPLAAAVQVNIEDLTLGSTESLPALSVGTDGSFLVAWISSPRPPGPFDRVPVVMARRYSAAGAPIQLPTVVSQSLIDERSPGVCIDSTGRGIVSWITIDEIRLFQPSKNGVALRRFGTTGNPIDTKEKTIAKPLANRSDVALSCGLTGSFVVAWTTDKAPVAPDRGTVVARYDKSGRRLGVVSLVATGAERPAISHDTAGNFVIVGSSQAGATTQIIGRRYLANGSADGATFKIAETTSLNASLLRAEVAHFGAAKAFAVAWEADQRNVFLRFFKAQ